MTGLQTLVFSSTRKRPTITTQRLFIYQCITLQHLLASADKARVSGDPGDKRSDTVVNEIVLESESATVPKDIYNLRFYPISAPLPNGITGTQYS